MTVHETRRNKTRRVETRRDETKRDEKNKGVLKLGFLWVCGSLAFRQSTNIVLKPTILWVCGPRTRLRAALGLSLVQYDRPSNPQFIGFQAQFRRFGRPQGMAPTHNLLSLGLDLDICQKKQHATLDGCAKCQRQRDANSRIRPETHIFSNFAAPIKACSTEKDELWAQNYGNFGRRKLLFYEDGLKPTIYWGWGRDLSDFGLVQMTSSNS